MVCILDATLTRDSMLELLCSRVGFFPTIKIDANVLKYIIASFPYMLKYKGTKLGIEYAVNSILKAEYNSYISLPLKTSVTLIRDNTSGLEDLYGNSQEYSITIMANIEIYNKKALDEVLKYVMPFGFTYNVRYYDSESSVRGSELSTNDYYTMYSFNNRDLSRLLNKTIIS
jgi:hypothetical protein